MVGCTCAVRHFRGLQQEAPPYITLASKVLQSRLWLPKTTEFVALLEQAVNNVGVARSMQSLSNWSVNRIGVNFMDGTPDVPARIKAHTDVIEESGLVVALELCRGAGGIVVSNNLQLILGADTCSSLGVEQAVHGGDNLSEKRYSVTFAQLKSSYS